MGGWHPDPPNRNAGPKRGRPARLICGEGDDSGLGVSGSPRGDAIGYPIQGISDQPAIRQRLVTRSTTLPVQMPSKDTHVALHNCDYIQIPYSGDAARLLGATSDAS